MRKKRVLETDEQRSRRLEKASQRQIDDALAADDAVDAMVRRNIQVHGP